MTIKFLKQWGQPPMSEEARDHVQRLLDGGLKIHRDSNCVMLKRETDTGTLHITQFCLSSPGEAVKFAAALNKIRRPLHLIKQDLDADWARRVKERDNYICALCGVQGDKVKEGSKGKDVLTAHHWFKTKARAGMARWARACGVTVHFAEHIHTLHENPCWLDLEVVGNRVVANEPNGVLEIASMKLLICVVPTEDRVRALWLENVGKRTEEPSA